MRLADISDYWKLRAIAKNPWEVIRFRKRGCAGRDLEVRLHGGRPLLVRGGQSDAQAFNRIFVRDEYRLAEHSASTWQVVVDIGANVGIFACRVADMAERVICYEPSPANFRQLERNTQGYDGIDTVCEAVADAPGILRLYRPADGSHSDGFTLYPKSDPGEMRFDAFDEVKATTLDALFERHRIARCDLLKIDAEGAEYEILYNASDATLERVGVIVGEYHDVKPEDPRTRIAIFRAHLESKGFATQTRPSRRHANQGHFFAGRPRLGSSKAL